MRLAGTALRLLALASLALATGGCKQSDSILLIEVAGPSALMPTQFRVTIASGMDGRALLVPAMPTPGDVIILPASFTVALDRSHMGPITLSIDALATDSNGAINTIGFGTTVMQHIQIGGQTDITVMLQEGLPPDMPDAGADGPTDAGQGGGGGGGKGGGGGGGGGGAGGAGGGGGQGGASGQAGSSASDGSVTDGGGAAGLDGATD